MHFFFFLVTQLCMWVGNPADWQSSAFLDECSIVFQSQGNEWFSSQSRRLTCFSRTLEENCIIHVVDWSLFLHIGADQKESAVPFTAIPAGSTIFIYPLCCPVCRIDIYNPHCSIVIRSCSQHICVVSEPRDALHWRSIPVVDSCSQTTGLRATRRETQPSCSESCINFSSDPSQRILVFLTSYSFHIHIHLLPGEVLSAACGREIWLHLMPDSGCTLCLSTLWEAM